MSEETLPSAEEMRARYAHLNDESAEGGPQSAEPEPDAPAVDEATEPDATEPEATEPEATEPEATEPEVAEPADSDALPSPDEMRARYAQLSDDAPAAAAEPKVTAPASLDPTPEPEPVDDVVDPGEDLALHLLDVKVRLWAELGRAQLPLAQAVALGAGAIVDLDREPDEALDVRVNGLPFAKGRLLLVDGEWAIRLEEIVADPKAVEHASNSGSGA
jgi:flagellar motor switch protein FliN